MNPQDPSSKRRLEAITSRREPPPGELDAEGRAWRGAWMELGRMIEDVEASLPAETASASPKASPAATAAPRRSPQRWFAAALAVLAASVLVAVVSWAVVDTLDTSQPVVPAPGELAAEPPAPPQAPPAAPKGPGRPEPDLPQIAADDPLRWDAAIDEEINSLAEAVVETQEDWYARNGGFDSVYYGLEQMERELSDETL